jgi:hypothetical protein
VAIICTVKEQKMLSQVKEFIESEGARRKPERLNGFGPIVWA